MATECAAVINVLSTPIDEGLLDRSMVYKLEDAIRRLQPVAEFLSNLEKVQPENEISSQLRPLFLEAQDGFSNICSHLNGQGRRSDTIRMISEVLKLIKPEVMAERIIASKPSTSSSRITVEMVGNVEALLDCTQNILFKIFGSQSFYPPISVFQMKLKYLQVILMLTAKRCIEHESMKDLFTLAEDLAQLTAHKCFLWRCYKDKTSVFKFLEMLSPFRPELRQIYLNVLIGLKSSRLETTMAAKDITHFVDTLKLDLEELLSRDASLKVVFDQNLWLQRGLSLLSRFLKNKNFNNVPWSELIPFQSHMEALAIEAAIVIYSYYDVDIDKITGIDHVLFLLQLKFNHVKIEIVMISY